MKRIGKALAGLLSVVALAGFAGGQTRHDESVTLETLRRLVARNEALIDPIKLDYTVQVVDAETSTLPAGGRMRGRARTHSNICWAQRGSKQYIQEDSFYGPGEPARSTLTVLDGLAETEVQLPDRMEATVSRQDSFDYVDTLPARVEMRPFQGQCVLTDLLVSEYAVLHSDMEVIKDRQAYVIDVSRPLLSSSCMRIWLDREAGVPVRVQLLDRHPTVPQARVYSEVNDVSLYRLSNGGWIPTSGIRTLDRQFGDTRRLQRTRICVDVNSIRVQPDEVPESLFEIDLPQGGVVYDARSGLTSIVGQPGKTYEQVVEGGARFIAGEVVDESGTPVQEAVVAAVVISMPQEDGRTPVRVLRPQRCAVTDALGRFAVELPEDGSYDLLFRHREFACAVLTRVPLGEHGLKVTLDRGGAVTGRVVRMIDGRKVPVAAMEAVMFAPNTPTLGPGRIQATSDAEGRFEFRCLERDRYRPRFASEQELPYRPIPWHVSCGRTSATVQFEKGERTKAVELVLRPDPAVAPSLVGRELPGLEGLGADLRPEELQGKMVLVCFFDLSQRPSRRCIEQLAQRARELEDRGIVVIAVQAAEVEPDALAAWRGESRIPFAVVAIGEDIPEHKYTWSVRSLPWLILTDRKHVVTAEGFPVSELDAKIWDTRSPTDAAEDPDKAIITVMDKQGNPLADVHVTETETQEQFTTDVKGQFICTLSDQMRFFCAVDKHHALALIGRLGPGQRQLNMELLPARVVSGQVTDPNGKPLAGVQIAPLPMSSFCTLTNEEGQFDIGWLPDWEPRGGLCLLARHVERNLAALVDISRQAIRVDIQLAPALALSGAVTATEGTPLSGATVSLLLRKWNWGCGTPVKRAVTDESGRFTLPALPQLQEYELHVRAVGYVTEELTTGVINVVKDREQIGPIVLSKRSPPAADEMGRLRVRVVDENLRPVDATSAQIWKKQPDGGARAESVSLVSTGTPGLYEIDQIPVGKYPALSIHEEGFAPFRLSDVQVCKEPPEVLTCKLSRGGTIEGVVTDDAGKPLAGLPVVINSILFRKDVTTDSNGYFIADHLPDTHYSVIVEPESESPYETTVLRGGTSCGARDLRIVVRQKREVKAPSSLVDTSIWQWNQLSLPLERSKVAGKAILLCLFDMNQRPSRNCLQQLGAKAKELEERGVIVAAAQVSTTDQGKVDEWIKESGIVFPVGLVQHMEDSTVATWHVESLPWLILTDRRHLVRAEGFPLEELDAKLAEGLENQQQ